MKEIWFFEFDTRQWSTKKTSGGKDNWTFGHAIRRSRYMYAYGTRHAVHTEESMAEVSMPTQVLLSHLLATLRRACSACCHVSRPKLQLLCSSRLQLLQLGLVSFGAQFVTAVAASHTSPFDCRRAGDVLRFLSWPQYRILVCDVVQASVWQPKAGTKRTSSCPKQVVSCHVGPAAGKTPLLC